jgi:putative transposase
VQPTLQTNSFAESWIGSMKRECLNLLFCFGLRQLDHIVQTYAMYHNRFRPHQALGNRPPDCREDVRLQQSDIDLKSVQCQNWLGGLLKHYKRKAA